MANYVIFVYKLIYGRTNCLKCLTSTKLSQSKNAPQKVKQNISCGKGFIHNNKKNSPGNPSILLTVLKGICYLSKIPT